ncbi:PKD domain-containing protein, partial [bacterium]|nr:PKD domain-containing protein [bacterium]
ELLPGSDLAGLVMGRLGRREFFRFNLLRFNIYYLTAALAALTVAVLILIPGPVTTEETAGPGLPEETVTAGTAAVHVQQDEAPLLQDTLNVTDANTRLAAMSDNAAVTSVVPVPANGKEPDREQALTYGRPVAETVSVSTVTREIANGTDGSREIAEVASLAVLSLETSVSSGCVPLHVSFTCNAVENAGISWSFGDGGTSSLKYPDYIYDIPGTYRVTLSVTDSRGRITSAGTVIEVWNRPRASFEVRKDDPWDEGDRVVFVNMSEGAVDYLWDFGDGVFSTLSDPSYRYEHMGNYDVNLTAWSAEGCADSVTVSDLFTDGGMYIRFPNAFVPNTGGPTGGYYNARTDEESTV